MSVSKWAYDPEKCDDHYCCGDCDLCDRANEPEGTDTPNVCKVNAFELYADLDTFDVMIVVEAGNQMKKAMEAAQRGFDEWYEDEDPCDTLLERVQEKLDTQGIKYKVITMSFDREYIEDLEEENENLTEQIRLMTISEK